MALLNLKKYQELFILLEEIELFPLKLFQRRVLDRNFSVSLQTEVSGALQISVPVESNKVLKCGGSWWREFPFGTSATHSLSPGLLNSMAIQTELTLRLHSWSHAHGNLFLSSGNQKYNLERVCKLFILEE